MSGLAEALREHGLFVEQDGVVRVPHLVRGRLVAPPELPHRRLRSAVTAAGPGARHVRLDGAQVLVEHLVDRKTGTVTGDRRYLVLPNCDPLDLVEWDVDRLVAGPYAVPFGDVVDLVDATGALLAGEGDLLASVVELVLATAPYPVELLAAELAGLSSMVDGAVLRSMVDRELSAWGRPGSAYLDGWVDLPGDPLPDPFHPLAAEVARRLGPPHPTATPDAADAAARVGGAGRVGGALRATSTRQLHIAAGNAPLVPAMSLLRMLATKGAGTVKLPAEAVLPGALLAAALAVAAGPHHPLVRHLSVVYWRGGDAAVEAALFAPESFDRIVVLGDVDAVASVRAGAPFTRVISFDPRYGASLIELPDPSTVEEVAALGAADVCLHDQKACDAAHVQYVVGSVEAAERYAAALRTALLAWHDVAPPVAPPGLTGTLARLRRGRLAQASWHPDPLAADPPEPAAPPAGIPTVVVSEAAFDVLEHPFSRFVVVRPVASAQAAVAALSRHVAAVGVWPEELRLAVRDRAAARGVSKVLPLGAVGAAYPGDPHDGMFALSALVDWTRG